MNFAVIFLCLLFGAIVGFEFGKYMEGRRIREAMKGISQGIKEAAEKVQKLAEKQQEQPVSVLGKLGVVGFDTRYYKTSNDIPAINKKEELDLCSRMITEMVGKGAMDSEIGRVVRYSMVVIDAEKLNLDWMKAKQDEGIDLLKAKYLRPLDGDIDDDNVVRGPVGGPIIWMSKAKEETKDGERI